MHSHSTVQELFNGVQTLLEESGIEEARQNTELILWEMLEFKNRMDIYLNRDAEITQGKEHKIFEIAKRRAERFPLQYLFQKTEFFGLTFKVSHECLIPRPETELLVERAIQWIRFQGLARISHQLSTASANSASSASSDSVGPAQHTVEYASHDLGRLPRIQSGLDALATKPDEKPGLCTPRILDVGTGSGNIAIAIAKNIERCQIIAIDPSQEALNIAAKNIDLHQVADRVQLIQAGVSNFEEAESHSFDLVISNPPYIDSNACSKLPDEVRLHEPRSALDGGENGLEIISRIIQESPKFLKPGGCLLIEFGGHDQTSDILDIIKGTQQFDATEILKDYALEDRMVRTIRR